jgi:vesicle-associated membrane protein 7
MADDAEPLVGEKSSSEAPSIASESDLGIQYCVVARAEDSVVLVEGNVREGNQHVLLAQQVLQSGQVSREGKRSVPLKSGNYYFHALTEDGLVFLCFSKRERKTSICFNFLAYVKQTFLATFSDEQWRTAIAYSTTFVPFSDTIVAGLKAYSDMKYGDSLVAENFRKIEDVKTTLKVAVDKLVERGQAIDELVKNADGLQDSSTTLKVNAMKGNKKR